MAETEGAPIVKKVALTDAEINALLGTPNATSIITPPANKKPNVFSRDPIIDLTFLDKPEGELSEEDKKKKEESDKAALLTKEAGDKILDAVTNTGAEKGEGDEDDANLTDEEKIAKKAAGRPKLDKSVMVEAVKKLIEDKILMPFDDEDKKPIDKYNTEDVVDLIKANFEKREEIVAEKVPGEFFETLSPELQYAAAYEANGGKDIKSIFRALGEVAETKALDIATEVGQEQVVLRYLLATKFGTSEEVQEQVNEWKDAPGTLEKKAKLFKPKLDAMQEEIVTAKVKQEEKARKQRESASEKYVQSIIKTLTPAELNGIKIDKKVQSMLYAGSVETQYPSLNGQPTNLLGHLLEKYQVVEPNHALILEATWLLADPDGYRAKVRGQGATAQAGETVRKLKIAEAGKGSGTGTAEEEEELLRKKSGKITRLKNIFAKE